MIALLLLLLWVSVVLGSSPSVRVSSVKAVNGTSVSAIEVEISSDFRIPRDGHLRLVATCPKLLDSRVFDVEYSDLPLGKVVYVPKFERLGYHMLEASLVSRRTRAVLASDLVMVALELDDQGDDELVLISPPIYPEFYTSQVPDQDYKYMEIFGFKTNGTFIEVGASDGKAYSNSYSLAEIGWRGLYVDPCPVEVRICKRNHKRHPKIQVHQAAVTSYTGQTKVHIAGPMSTILPEMIGVFRNISWAKKMNELEEWVDTPAVTLNELLKSYEVSPNFELLIVDIEGSELDLMKGFDLNFWRPQAVMVELMDFHPDFNKSQRVVDQCQAVRAIFAEAGYGVYWQDVADTLFVSDPTIKMQHDSDDIRKVVDGEVVASG